jgi:Holliday junction resolvase RusA-like endonuclease
MIELTLTGETPSKKNSKRWIKRGQKTFLVPSDNYENWEIEKSFELVNIGSVKGCCTIEMTFFTGTKRRGDLDNKATSILDLLKKYEVIEDDNWWVVSKLILMFGGVDRKNPRVEVRLKELLGE